MRGVVRRLLSSVSLLLLGLGVAETAALHAHPLDESDLVAHSIAWVERGAGCGPATHFDAGRLGLHPTCVDCVLAASPAAVSRLVAVAGESLVVEGALGGAPADAVLDRSSCASGARAPPAA